MPGPSKKTTSFGDVKIAERPHQPELPERQLESDRKASQFLGAVVVPGVSAPPPASIERGSQNSTTLERRLSRKLQKSPPLAQPAGTQDMSPTLLSTIHADALESGSSVAMHEQYGPATVDTDISELIVHPDFAPDPYVLAQKSSNSPFTGYALRPDRMPVGAASVRIQLARAAFIDLLHNSDTVEGFVTAGWLSPQQKEAMLEMPGMLHDLAIRLAGVDRAANARAQVGASTPTEFVRKIAKQALDLLKQSDEQWRATEPVEGDKDDA